MADDWQYSTEGIPYKAEPWSDWYAWRPIRINGIWVWLEAIERRTIHYDGLSLGRHSATQYRFKWPRP